jgi:hypothetical protein
MPAFPGEVHELVFNKSGELVDPAQLDSILTSVKSGSPTDVLVLSHGWNNDMAEARSLYTRLRERLAVQLSQFPALAGRRFLNVDLFWPSKKFADKQLIPGGAAAAGALVNDIIQDQLQTLEDLLEDEASADDFKRARALVPRLQDGNSQAQAEFAAIVLKYLPKSAKEEGDFQGTASMTTGMFGARPLLEVLGMPAPLAPPEPRKGGGAAIAQEGSLTASRGGAAGLGDLLSGAKAGAINLLNFTTYYKMKERAGAIGESGVNSALRTLHSVPNAPNLHLIGHSFGGRLVTAAVLGPTEKPAVPIKTLALLQAAFSHYGLAKNYRQTTKSGFFRRVVDDARVKGPILITHTRNDTAVGVLYAIASRLARQVAAALGDEHDQYGGMGGNGAQDTPEAVKAVLNDPGTPYQLQGGRIYNLRSDKFIASHSDVANDAVAYAILSGVAIQ